MLKLSLSVCLIFGMLFLSTSHLMAVESSQDNFNEADEYIFLTSPSCDWVFKEKCQRLREIILGNKELRRLCEYVNPIMHSNSNGLELMEQLKLQVHNDLAQSRSNSTHSERYITKETENSFQRKIIDDTLLVYKDDYYKQCGRLSEIVNEDAELQDIFTEFNIYPDPEYPIAHCISSHVLWAKGAFETYLIKNAKIIRHKEFDLEKKETIQVVVTTDKKFLAEVEDLKRQLKHSGLGVDLKENLEFKVRNLDKEFTVTNLSESSQPLIEGTDTVWSWYVLPRRGGKHSITIKGYIQMIYNDELIKMEVCSKEVSINTRWDLIDFFKDNWDRVLGLLKP